MPYRVLLLVAIMAANPLRADAPVALGLRVPPGFTVTEFAGDDLVHDCYTLAINPKGQVVVAGRGYIRTLIDDDGDGRADRAIEIADHPKDGAMGLLWEGDTLWAVGDGGLRRFKIGPDGKAAGPSELVYKLKTGGEHDAHALRRGPDGWLYLLCGNSAGISAKDAGRPTSPIHDPIAGAVLRFPPDMSYCEIVADGFRNPYDFDFNGDGELITFDSDNERCVGLPWYEGCRLYHVIPGGHYGWRAPQRAAFWRMPPYYPDVIAPLADIGRGSPTGVACYRHRQFPEKYRGGVFLGDWTFGRIYFASLTQSGSTYSAKVEPFLESVGDNGFAPTGLAVHPTTGDLYVSIGGRGTRGAVYRIRYDAGVKESAGYRAPPFPHREPGMAVTHSRSGPETPLELVRLWQRLAGDIGGKVAIGTVFEGYTVRSPKDVPPECLNEIRRRFPCEQRDFDRELSRMLAIIGAGDADLFQRVIDKVTPSSDPVEDIHYLIVLARMTAPRTPATTTAIAKALLRLDRKFSDRRTPRRTGSQRPDAKRGSSRSRRLCSAGQCRLHSLSRVRSPPCGRTLPRSGTAIRRFRLEFGTGCAHGRVAGRDNPAALDHPMGPRRLRGRDPAAAGALAGAGRSRQVHRRAIVAATRTGFDLLGCIGQIAGRARARRTARIGPFAANAGGIKSRHAGPRQNRPPFAETVRREDRARQSPLVRVARKGPSTFGRQARRRRWRGPGGVAKTAQCH
jgi:glucose/arabinose dehydrogenase